MRGCALEEDDGAADDDDISSYSNLERRFCASKWRKFQEKNASFSQWTCEIIIIYRDIKKEEERERERVKEEGELVECSI